MISPEGDSESAAVGTPLPQLCGKLPKRLLSLSPHPESWAARLGGGSEWLGEWQVAKLMQILLPPLQTPPTSPPTSRWERVTYRPPAGPWVPPSAQRASPTCTPTLRPLPCVIPAWWEQALMDGYWARAETQPESVEGETTTFSLSSTPGKREGGCHHPAGSCRAERRHRSWGILLKEGARNSKKHGASVRIGDEKASESLAGLVEIFITQSQLVKIGGDGCYFKREDSNIRLKEQGASLVAQWLRIHLPMQGTWVWALVWKDPTCCRATKPMRHNYRACALEPASHNYWAHMPQLLKPTCLEPVLHNKRSHRNEKPAHHNKE